MVTRLDFAKNREKTSDVTVLGWSYYGVDYGSGEVGGIW